MGQERGDGTEGAGTQVSRKRKSVVVAAQAQVVAAPACRLQQQEPVAQVGGWVRHDQRQLFHAGRISPSISSMPALSNTSNQTLGTPLTNTPAVMSPL